MAGEDSGPFYMIMITVTAAGGGGGVRHQHPISRRRWPVVRLGYLHVRARAGVSGGQPVSPTHPDPRLTAALEDRCLPQGLAPD